MRVLVTYGSTRGGTEGLAHLVADDLRDEGVTVDLLPPSQVKNLDDYDAVVVGGALYSSRWHRQARQFVRQHTGELRQRPTFFFPAARWTTRPAAPRSRPSGRSRP
jgi:menaquinone-dependent protoporphyrinogen oxidase